MYRGFNTWKNTALARLPGALDAVVESELEDTIDEFCRRSTVWREMVYALDISATYREISVVIGNGNDAIVAGILRVYYNQMRLTEYSHAPFEVESTYPTGYTTRSTDPSKIILTSIPSQSEADCVDALVFAMPFDATQYLPPLLTDNCHEYILDGLLARMYAHPSRPYTNEALALAHMRKYSAGIASARSEANRGFTGNAQNWTFPSFGR